jgi:hypothetical protein
VSACTTGADGVPCLVDELKGSRLLANLEELTVCFDDVSTRVLVAHCPRLKSLCVQHGGRNPFVRMALYAAICPTLEYANLWLQPDGDPDLEQDANFEITIAGVVDVYRNYKRRLQAKPHLPRNLGLRRIVFIANTEFDTCAAMLDMMLQYTPDLRQFIMRLDNDADLSDGIERVARTEHINSLAYMQHLTHMRIELGDSLSSLAREHGRAWRSLTHLHVTASPTEYPDNWSLVDMTHLEYLTVVMNHGEAWTPPGDYFNDLFERLPTGLRELVFCGEYEYGAWTKATTAALIARFPRLESFQFGRAFPYTRIYKQRFDWTKLEK